MTDRLLSKVAVITGADGPVGLAIADRFLDEGAKVVAFGIKLERLERLTAKAPARVLTVEGTATNPQDLRRLADAVSRRFGNIDVIVAAEQKLRLAPFIETTPELLRETWEENVASSFETVRLLFGSLGAGGSVLFFGVADSVANTLGMSAYHASRGAIASLARALSNELSAGRLRVNAIALELLHSIYANQHRLSNVEVVNLLKSSNLKSDALKSVDGEAIANTALFLASDDSRQINGEQIVIRDPTG